MALVVKDRVRVVTTTTGTTDFALGSAVTGYQSFSVIGNGNTTYYAATDSITGDWEVGIGTYVAAGPTLTRDTILESSNAGSKVVFSAGTKDVFVTYPAERSVYLNGAGSAVDVLDVGTLGVGTANITTANITSGTVATTPTSGTDIANKTYVDTLVSSGITYHAPVKYEVPNTTGNLNATYNNGVAGVGATLTNAGTKAAFAPDGPTAQVGDRILVYNQTNQFENGVYEVTTVGSPDPGGTNWVLTRAADADSYGVKDPNSLGNGDAFFITSGNTGAGETYLCNTTGTITFGTTAITFVQISDATLYTAGTGLTLSGTEFSITPVGTAGTYGSASQVPVIATNASGQVSSVTNTAIAISAGAVSGLAASATTDTTNANNITSGTLNTARISGSYTGISGVGTLTAGTWNASVIAAAYGGTGLTSYAVGDLLYADTTTSLAKLPDVVAGNALLSGGIGTAPSWGKVELTTHVSGVLPVVNGGTGTTTPSLVAGTNVTITGSWPNQTINASGGGGGSSQVGDIFVGTQPPASGTWLETGKYYSKSTYSNLATELGDIPDFGELTIPSMNIANNSIPIGAIGSTAWYVATNGVVTVVANTSSSNACLRTTTDGINWTPSPSGLIALVANLQYVNGLFIATCAGGQFLYSSNGYDWKYGAAVSPQVINEIAYGAGRYVIVQQVSSSFPIWYSTDLANWLPGKGNVTYTPNAQRIIYANSMFVAAGQSGQIWYSSDGENWTPVTVSFGNSPVRIVYAAGLFVLAGAASPIILTSPDGITWTNRGSLPQTLYKIKYVNSTFIAVGLGIIYTSPDAITWTSRLSGFAGSWEINDVEWTGSQYIAVGNKGLILTSPDAVTWTPEIDPLMSAFVNCAVISGKTIAVGSPFTMILDGAPRAVVGQLATSATTFNCDNSGTDTTNISVPITIAYDGVSTYVAVSVASPAVKSNDLVTWTPMFVCNNSQPIFIQVFYLNGRWFITGSRSNDVNVNTFYTSTDAITWTGVNLVSGATRVTHVAYGAGVWVAGTNSSGAPLFSSPDGLTWTQRSTQATTVASLTFDNGLFVAGTTGGALTSSDGITWTNRAFAVNTSLRRVRYLNSRWLGTDNSQNIWHSTDAITWTQIAISGGTGGYNDIAWNGSTMVAVGTGGKVATSPSGAVGTWTYRGFGDNNANMSNLYYSTAFNMFVAPTTGNTPATGLVTSLDGVYWVKRPMLGFVGTQYINEFVSGTMVAMSRLSLAICSSNNLVNWSGTNMIAAVAPLRIRSMYKFGAVYFCAASNGLYKSTDGATWDLIPTVFQIVNSSGANRWMASDGSVLVTVASVSGINVIQRSTDGGTTWTITELIGKGTWTATAGTNVVTSLMYANGNFIIALGQQIPGAVNPTAVYTSPDGVTWTPRGTFNITVQNGTQGASDGTIAVLPNVAGSGNGLIKSTDGGETWQQVAMGVISTQHGVLYQNGYWWVSGFGGGDSLDSIASSAYTSAALSAIPATVLLHVTTDYVITVDQNWRVTILRKGAPGGVTRFLKSPYNMASNTGFVGQLPEAIKINDSLITSFGSAPIETVNPSPIWELPLYSYNTSTTFWVPPYYGSGGVAKSWIYAGP